MNNVRSDTESLPPLRRRPHPLAAIALRRSVAPDALIETHFSLKNLV